MIFYQMSNYRYDIEIDLFKVDIQSFLLLSGFTQLYVLYLVNFLWVYDQFWVEGIQLLCLL